MSDKVIKAKKELSAVDLASLPDDEREKYLLKQGEEAHKEYVAEHPEAAREIWPNFKVANQIP